MMGNLAVLTGGSKGEYWIINWRHEKSPTVAKSYISSIHYTYPNQTQPNYVVQRYALYDLMPAAGCQDHSRVHF